MFFISGVPLIYINVNNCLDNVIFFKQLLVRNEFISMLFLEVKDDTAKYEETISELKRKGQIRKFKQISYWPLSSRIH